MCPYGVGERVGGDGLRAGLLRLYDLQVAPRQEFSWRRDVAGIARELDAVFRSAERRGADALAGWQQWPGKCPGVDAAADGVAEAPPHVAEVAGLAAIH